MEGRIHYQCPSNFSAVSDCDGSVTSEPDTEIWLIKAPLDFNPESLNSHRFPLPGYKMQKVKSGGMKRFCHVLSSPCSDAPFTPLLCHPEEGPGGRLVCVPSFQGTITVAEAHGDPSALHTIPDRPPLSIPPGLKQRFQPFGALPPKGGRAVDSLLAGGRKKKKKAKKRRQEEMEH
ncbi:DNA-directed RNA polymerase I subunit RPA34 isoform X2 [Lithobates pipiens]